MSIPGQMTSKELRRQKVLEVLREGVRTWDEIRALTKINEEHLGYVIGELLDLRQIWTLVKGDTRVYGIERRLGLVPRFANVHRRASDSHA
jgi:hypothetical protein